METAQLGFHENFPIFWIWLQGVVWRDLRRNASGSKLKHETWKVWITCVVQLWESSLHMAWPDTWAGEEWLGVACRGGRVQERQEKNPMRSTPPLVPPDQWDRWNMARTPPDPGVTGTDTDPDQIRSDQISQHSRSRVMELAACSWRFSKPRLTHLSPRPDVDFKCECAPQSTCYHNHHRVWARSKVWSLGRSRTEIPEKQWEIKQYFN